MFIYSTESRHLSTITTNDNGALCDATWTPRGNILYSKLDFYEVVAITESGKVIKKTRSPCSMSSKYFGYRNKVFMRNFLSVSNDGMIYLTKFEANEYETGVFQSTDDGVSWSLLFKLLDGRQYWQVIKVIADHGDDFWTVERNYDFTWHIRVYNHNRKLSDGNVTWGDIIPINKTYSAFEIRLSYDYNMNIFLSDHFTVNLFSVNDQYHCQLLSN